MRPSIDAVLLEVAGAFAARSTCSRLQVGAVLARAGRVLSAGYNGAPAGLPHCEHVDDAPCAASVHAEANALVAAARHGVAAEGAQLYCTHAPCLACAGLAVNAGLAAVVYAAPFRSTAGLELLAAAGVEVIPHPQGARP